MPNGRRCKSPALKGALFCYFHARIHSLGKDPNAKFGNMRLPVPEDPAAIQLAIAQITDALINGRIDNQRCAQLLYAMQIASQHVDKCRFEIGMKTVESTTQSGEGDDLAPEERICDCYDICVGCPYADSCPKFDPDNREDDDDEEENDDDDE